MALVEMNLPVEFRMAVVPGYTDTAQNIERVADFLARLGKTELHLLAYHNMGEAKIDIVQGSQPRLGLAGLSDERLSEVRFAFRGRGINISNGD